jgi:hypothetical protein
MVGVSSRSARATTEASVPPSGKSASLHVELPDAPEEPALRSRAESSPHEVGGLSHDQRGDDQAEVGSRECGATCQVIPIVGVSRRIQRAGVNNGQGRHPTLAPTAAPCLGRWCDGRCGQPRQMRAHAARRLPSRGVAPGPSASPRTQRSVFVVPRGQALEQGHREEISWCASYVHTSTPPIRAERHYSGGAPESASAAICSNAASGLGGSSPDSSA